MNQDQERKKGTWFSFENLKKAFRYAMLDAKDDFVFDVFGHWDVRLNRDYLLKTLRACFEIAVSSFVNI
jgi:hypothetical protein